MENIPVRLTYFTGIADELFRNPVLLGSWDADGRYSDEWSSTAMQVIRGPDGCPAFTALIELAAEQVGWWFHWGVQLDGPHGNQQWAIVEEVNDERYNQRFCSFRLAARATDVDEQQEVYCLSQARRLGAQKHYSPNSESPAMRFSVWAPNARQVEVVMATLWRAGDPHRASTIDPSQTPANQSLPRGETGGGYVADGGEDVLDNWGPFEMVRDAHGVWSTDLTDPRLQDFATFDHAPYMFRITKDDGTVAYRTDLYSRCQIGFGSQRPRGPFVGRTTELDGTVSCSVVVDPDRVTAEFSEPVWPETKWLSANDFWRAPEFQPQKDVPRRLEDLVIYELHVGALGFGRAAHEPGTLQDALEFLDYLEELGVNAIELLPLSEFGGGGGGWGYATSHYFAIEYSGGGRDNYKWFIRECHRRGIAVILDVVFNHYHHDAERAQWMVDSKYHNKNSYYWYEGLPADYEEFNNRVAPERWGTGGYVDNLSNGWAPRYADPMVRRMFVSATLTQALEFNIDGFRVDQTTSIHAYNVSHADNRSPVERANVFGQKLLRELTTALKLVQPSIMLMAEDHSQWPSVTLPTQERGLGFDAVWDADFYHHLIGDTDKGSDYAKLIKTAGFGDDRPLAMDRFASALASTGGKRIVYHESHDEARNGKFTQRTIRTAVNAAPLRGETRRVAEARCRFAAGMAMLSAGTPMFLFGEEVGAEKPFLYGHVLENREDLLGMRQGSGAKLFNFYRRLIRLRLEAPGLTSRNIEIIYVHNENRVLAFRRWSDNQEYMIVASLNNRSFAAPGYSIYSPLIQPAMWRKVFDSDATEFGGDGGSEDELRLETKAGEFSCRIPANGFVVWMRDA